MMGPPGKRLTAAELAAKQFWKGEAGTAFKTAAEGSLKDQIARGLAELGGKVAEVGGKVDKVHDEVAATRAALHGFAGAALASLARLEDGSARSLTALAEARAAANEADKRLDALLRDAGTTGVDIKAALQEELALFRSSLAETLAEGEAGRAADLAAKLEACGAAQAAELRALALEMRGAFKQVQAQVDAGFKKVRAPPMTLP